MRPLDITKPLPKDLVDLRSLIYNCHKKQAEEEIIDNKIHKIFIKMKRKKFK